MQNHHLQFLQDFSETISSIFKKIAHLCRQHSEKMKETNPQLVNIYDELAKERKKRIELEQIIRQKVMGNPQTEQNTDSNNQDQRKRPKSAFMLFVADQRQKILREHPSLDLYKITTLAAIKWRKLSRQQQLVYQKKLQEMNKISDEQILQARQRLQASKEAIYVKRQYQHEQQRAENQLKNNQQNQQQPTQTRQNEQPQENHNNEIYQQANKQNGLNQNNQIQGTLVIQNQYNFLKPIK